ncbi:hypothetical protein USDA257_c09610 [Sinorhizobium fredii USDA 257]|uniref:DUF393 domain-containing protein n=1 Tax=Sinorhizobium fredii (strain USDA 257) TaxID=1185652 RepID=I3X0Z7_SINF2|nr:hypothetical protein USDA257_c09610 [Sinorhizobium fredii USDA 257]
MIQAGRSITAEWRAMDRYSYKNDPALPPFPDERPIFVFDAECVFCSGGVKFALKHEKDVPSSENRHRFIL